MRGGLPFAFGLFLLAGSPVGAQGEPAPARIVSMNLCADELVLRLAEASQVASVTWLAHDGRGSNVAAPAREVGVNHGLAEEVLRDRPELVVAGRYTTRTTVAFLRRLELPVMELDVPGTLAETYRQIAEVAAAVGHPERGEVMIAAMRAALDGEAGVAAEDAPRALVLRPNGVTVGPGSLVDAVLRQAGLANAAVDLGLESYAQMPLEVIVRSGAEILIVDADDPSAPSLATELLRHPAIERLGRGIEVVALPTRLWTCAGPMLVDAVRRLEAAGLAVRATRTGG